MKPSRLWKLQARYAPYLFLTPFVALFCVFMLYPLARSLFLSFHKAAGPRREIFVGFNNYRFLLQDRLFWGSLANTTLFAIVFLILQIPASLGLALLLNDKRVRGRSFFRFAFFSTYLVGPVFVAVLFSVLLDPRHGLVNRLIQFLTASHVEINWLAEPALVMPAIILAALWLSVGFGMIYFLAALQTVDRELYEAAQVDGAGAWSRFWHVTLPSIKPVLIFMILVGTIGAYQLFELPWVLCGQTTGPAQRGLTVVMYLFLTGFEAGDLGYAAAIGWMLVIVMLIISLVQIRLSGALREGAKP